MRSDPAAADAATDAATAAGRPGAGRGDGGRAWRPVASALLGIAAALVGLLPWLVTGARLPLQNLWSVDAMPQDMPRALLPLSQYRTLAIFGMLVAGGVLAGCAARGLRAAGLAQRGGLVTGLVLAQAGAVAQSFATLRRGLGLGADDRTGWSLAADPRASTYWWGVLAGTVIVCALAAGIAWLLARGPRPGAALGLVLAAVPLGHWAGLWIVSTGGPAGVHAVTPHLVRWVPVATVAAALFWCGVGSGKQAAVWVAGAAVLLTAPPVLTAVTSAVGMRVLHGDTRATVDLALATLRSQAAIGVLPACVAIALAGTTRLLVARGR